MKIRNQEIEVDVKNELEEFSWSRATWKHDKLIAISPFRMDDSSPSFFVRLKEGNGYSEGVWGDSGGTDYTSGTFPRLLAFLRNETVKETEDYLLDKYGGEVGYKDLFLSFDEFEKPTRRKLDESEFEEFPLTSDYLTNRGISTRIQEIAGIRDTGESVLIPWRDEKGNLCQVKFRHKNKKYFWYHEEGTPIEKLVWGMDLIYKHRCHYAVLCESETDSLTLLSHGIPSIAIGGTNFSKTKEEIIMKSPIQSLYIATDNDKIGEKLKKQISWKMKRYMNVYIVDIPNPYKDINDIKEKTLLQNMIKKSRKIDNLFFK